MGNRHLPSYTPKCDDYNHYIAEYIVRNQLVSEFISTQWKECMDFIIIGFDKYKDLDVANMENDLTKHGWVERYVDNTFFVKGTIRTASLFCFEIMYDNMAGARKSKSEKLNVDDKNWFEILAKYLGTLNVSDAIIQDVIANQKSNPKVNFSRIYNNSEVKDIDANIYISVSFSFY